MGVTFTHYLDGTTSHSHHIGRSVTIGGEKYVYQKIIGSGGFGSVYEATNSNGKRVAIKIVDLTRSPSTTSGLLVSTYLSEVRLLERLRRETRHVVHIYGFDFDPKLGEAYIVMELGNENLSTLIDRLRAMNPRGTVSIDEDMIKVFWRQMVSILRTLRSHNIVHMDIKPDNLILFGTTLKIADLGISRKADVAGVGGMGTIGYTAPEIMEAPPGSSIYYGPKADIWSLGAILYNMVYGEEPTYSRGPIPPPPHRRPHPDPHLNDMLRRTLVRNPKHRADLNEVMGHPFTRI